MCNFSKNIYSGSCCNLKIKCVILVGKQWISPYMSKIKNHTHTHIYAGDIFHKWYRLIYISCIEAYELQ